MIGNYTCSRSNKCKIDSNTVQVLICDVTYYNNHFFVQINTIAPMTVLLPK